MWYGWLKQKNVTNASDNHYKILFTSYVLFIWSIILPRHKDWFVERSERLTPQILVVFNMDSGWEVCGSLEPQSAFPSDYFPENDFIRIITQRSSRKLRIFRFDWEQFKDGLTTKCQFEQFNGLSDINRTVRVSGIFERRHCCCDILNLFVFCWDHWERPCFHYLPRQVQTF